MKKIILIAVLLLMLAIAWHLHQRLGLAKQRSYYPLQPRADTSLQVGIMGDSWVSNKKLDSLLQSALLASGKKVTVFSAGKDGARSKEMYLSFFSEDEIGAKQLLQQQPKYMIIIAGVNDAQSYVGAANYAHHAVLMMQLLLHYKIKPVWVALPWFDIGKAQQGIGLHRQWRNKMCRAINAEPVDNIALYRSTLMEQIKAAGLQQKVCVLHFDAVFASDNSRMGFYKDALHLNEQGNKHLAAALATALLDCGL